MENQHVTKIRSPVEPDSVDVSLDVWSRELPDLDLGIEGIVERIDKLKHYVDRAMQKTLEARLGLSSGAMTNRLDNMERRGVIRRIDDPDDRRGVIIEITDEGRRLWDETVGAQAEKE